MKSQCFSSILDEVDEKPLAFMTAQGFRARLGSSGNTPKKLCAGLIR
jgi:hypothetical protein